jgi:predicted permease
LARFNTSGQGRSESLSGELVSGNYFQVLGVRPALGRLLLPQDETEAGANPVAVLSYGCWERRYAKSPGILNKQLNVNGAALTVVGIAQAGFDGVQVGEMPDIFIPVTMKAQMTPNWDGLADHTDRWLALIGRMKPGRNRQNAEAALQTLYHQVLEADLPFMKYSKQEQPAFLARKLLLNQGARGRPILEEQIGEPLIFLAAMVGLILLIACSNLASLLIARGEARHREIGVRLSLGAPRRRIVRQLLTENLLLAVAGGVAGLALAFGILRTLSGPIEQSIGSLHVGTRLDFRMLAFAASASLVTGILFGLAPALRVVRADPQAGLQDRSSKAAGSRSNVRLRKWLMVFQVAMTVLLMAEAALFTQTLLNLKHTDLGMRSDHVVQFSISPELNHYSPTQTIALVESLRKKLLTVPGVLGVGATEVALFANDERSGNVTVEGYTFNDDDDEKTSVHKNLVGPGYFAAMETPLLSGREFTESDVIAAPKVAIINESVARRYFSGRDPIGQHFTFGGGKVHPDIEIVGVVKDSKYMGARDAAVPFAFLPYAQDNKMGTANFYVRTAQDPLTLAETIRKTVAGLDDNLPVDNMKTLEQQLDISMFGERALAFLTLCLGGLAVLLAAVGLYGVMAYVVARRTREIGIRIALGATRQGIAWLVVREVLRMMIIGLSIGIILAFAVGRAISSLLFGVTPGNPVIMALTALVLAGVAIMAGTVPARKAAYVDPIVALRYE